MRCRPVVTRCAAFRLSIYMFRALAGILGLLLAGLSGYAADTSQQGQADSSKFGSIRGTIVSLSGEPLRKVSVSVSSQEDSGRARNMAGGQGQGGWSATTDTAGAWAIAGLPPGNYVVSARRTGYLQAVYGTKSNSRNSPAPVPVAAGQEVTGIDFRLTPQAVIAGKVVDEDGDPVQFASVQVLRERWLNGRRQQSPLNADSTNDLGEYRIPNLNPGRYYLRVSLNRQGPQNRQVSAETDQTYVPNFYPGVSDWSQAAPIQLTPGAEMRGVDFRIRRTTTWRVRGRVLDEAGKPAMFVGVMALPEGGGSDNVRAMGMVRNQEGNFEIAGLSPGTYSLIANRQGRDGPRSSARTTVQVGNRDVEGIVVQLQRAFGISGVVHVEGDGVQLATPKVTIDPLESGVPVYRENDGAMQGDGTWHLNGLSAGRYRLGLSGIPDTAYLKAVRVDGQDITAGAQISSAATGIEMVVAANAPEVSGTVLGVDKQPIGSATVVLAPESSALDRYWLIKTTTADNSGSFTLRGITPGQYVAYALTQVEDGLANSPDFIRTLEGKGTPVKLAEGAHETVQVTLAQ